MSKIQTKFIEDAAITAAKLATDSVTNVKILDGTILRAKLANGIIDAAHLDVDSVTTIKIVDTAVTANKLATDSVTSAKIQADAVTTVKILNANVTNAKIATGVDATKIADGSVTNSEFQFINSVTSNVQTQLDNKASTTLNNLGTTNINSSLLFSANNAFDVGSSSNNVRQLHVREIDSNNGILFQTSASDIEFLSFTEDMSFYSNAGVVAPKFKFWDKNGAFSSGIKSADTLSADTLFQLPSDNGTSGYVLSTDGYGVTSWIAASGSGATTALDNLTTTNINQSLLFDTDLTYDIGSTTNNLNAIYGTKLTAHDSVEVSSSTEEVYLQSSFERIALYSFGGSTAPSLVFANADDSGEVSIKSLDGAFTSYTLTLPPDDGTSGQVLRTDGAGVLTWVTVAAGESRNKETFTLSGTDITNQYIDLAHVALTSSIHFIVKGGAPTVEGASYDYSVSYTGGAGGNTRITFLNDLATGGGAALIATDVVQVVYEY